MLIQTASAWWLAAALAAPAAQPPAYNQPKARRHFVSVSVERQFVQPFGFDKHPLSDLLGQPVDEVHLESFQYRTRDERTLVNVIEYEKRTTAIGATVEPVAPTSFSGSTISANS